MTQAWPWLALAGLGAFHGLNPAMGWLFAVALGLHRQSLACVLWALPAIALGHALSVALVASALAGAGMLIEPRAVQLVSGALLIGWASYHALYGHKHRVRFGMQVGLAGLVAWSFLMATAHGAGVMALPALMPLCVPTTQSGGVGTGAVAWPALAGVGVHTIAMLAVTGAIAVAVYRWIGLAILRSAWINFDLVWTFALLATGLLLLVVA
jgi:hypothetical protein